MYVLDPWFQQDDDTPHFTNETILKKSCELTQLNYFLWSCVIRQVYKHNLKLIPKLKDKNICLIVGKERKLKCVTKINLC